jgi:hypothetical protein
MKESSSKFVPCIFIGLGGSGSGMVTALRQKILSRLDHEGLDKNDYLDKVFQFIAIDTTNKGHRHFGVPESNYINLGQFNGTEVVRLQERENAAKFNKWWYPDFYPGFLMFGAGTTRVNGRLCLIQNLRAGGTTVVSSIQRSCATAMGILQEGTAPINAVKVYFFSSICGGTGSGILIDLAVLARNVLSASNPWIFAYLITPEIVLKVAGERQKPQLFANAYACCKEISFWQDPSNSGKYDFSSIGFDIKLPKGERPFDLIHIFSGKNADGKEMPNFEKAHRLVADVVYHNAISPHTGQQATDAIFDKFMFYKTKSIVKHQISGAERAISFGSGCMAQLRFPQEKIRSFLGMELLEYFIRNYIWKEADASILFNDFITNRASLGPGELEKKILEDVKLPSEPIEWRQKIREINKEAWEGECDEIEKAIHGYKSRINKYLEEEKKPSLLNEFKVAIDGMLRNTLDLSGGPTRFGLVAQLIEKLEVELIGRVKRKDEERGSCSGNRFVDLLDATLNELERLGGFDLQEAKKNLEDAFSISGFKFWSKSRFIEDAKDRLENAYSVLINKEREYLIRSKLLQYFDDCLHIIQFRKKGIKFIRQNLLNDILKKVAREKANVLVGDEYDDERGGLIIEILGDRNWVLNSDYNKRYRTEADQEKMDGFAEILLTTGMGIGIENLSLIGLLESIWIDIEHGLKDSLLEQRMERFIEGVYTPLLKKCMEEFEDVRETSIWKALIWEAHSKGYFNKEKIKEHINNRCTELIKKAAPFWDLNKPVMEEYVHKNLRKDLVTLSLSKKAFKQFGEDYHYLTVGDIFGLALGDFNEIESYDPSGLTLVKLEYGFPLFSLNIAEGYEGYHQNYETQKEMGLPLHADRRYEEPSDKTFGIPDLQFPTGFEKDRLMFLLAEWFSPKKEELKLSDGTIKVNYLVVPVEQEKKAFIRHTKDGRYTLMDGRGASKSRKGRNNAEGEFPTLPVFQNVREQVIEYWRQNFTIPQRKNKLIQIKSFLEDWKNRVTNGELSEEIGKDLSAIEEKLKLGGDYLI